jgi:hypothetical protein
MSGMAKKITNQSVNGFDTFAVHVKGRISTPTKNVVMRKVIDETGFVQTPEFDDESLNRDTRLAYFFTSAISKGNVSFSFFQQSPDIFNIEEVDIHRTIAAIAANGDFSSIVNVNIPSTQSVIGSKLFYNVTNVPVKTYAILALDEGFSIVTDIDDTIRVAGVSWLQTLYVLAFKKKFMVAPTMPEYFFNLQTGLSVTSTSGLISPPTYHYLSGSPQQFLPALQAWMGKHYPAGEFVLPPLANSDGSIFGLKKYFEFKVEQTIEIAKFFPNRKLILFGDATQYDTEAYAEVYRQFPDNIQCIFIRIVEGFNFWMEKKKNDPYRFLKAFIHIPHYKWMVFRNTTELPSPEDIKEGMCRDPDWVQHSLPLNSN